MLDRVLVSADGGVAHVRLNRPDKLNAFDRAMFEGIVAVGDALRADSSVRAIVLSGEGRAFSAGLDFASFLGDGGAGDRLFSRTAESPANLAQRTSWVWREVAVPVIAAVHGYAFGAGLQVALGADLRVVAPGAELSVMEIRWGLVPDMGGTQLLRDLVRADVAKELTFTGRRVSGTEAVSLGLATRVHDDPVAAALDAAREIAAKSPQAIRAAKRLLDRSRRLPEREGLELEEALQRELLGSESQLEAVRANLEKRAPSFRDPS